jgi:hypothetical protein
LYLWLPDHFVQLIWLQVRTVFGWLRELSLDILEVVFVLFFHDLHPELFLLRELLFHMLGLFVLVGRFCIAIGAFQFIFLLLCLFFFDVEGFLYKLWVEEVSELIFRE